MNTQHVYTCKGNQRAIFGVAKYGETIAFSIELHHAAPTDNPTYLEMTDDADAVVRSGKATWHPVNGATGYIAGATALRVANNNSGWTKLNLEWVEGPDAACIGLATRNNAILATINADMRFCAAAA